MLLNCETISTVYIFCCKYLITTDREPDLEAQLIPYMIVKRVVS